MQQKSLPYSLLHWSCSCKMGLPTRDIEMHGHQLRVHHFDHEGRDIWGLTAAFLIGAAEAAFGRPAAFQVWHSDTGQPHP